MTITAGAGINPDFNSANDNKYTPVLYSKKVMMLFVEQTILGEITNGDYEGDIKGKGDKVEIRVAPPTLIVQDYDAGDTLSFTQSDYASRNLEIDQSKAVAFEFDEIEKVQSDLNLFNMYAERAAYSLNVYESRDVLTVMGAGAFGVAGGVSGSNTAVDAANAAKPTGAVDPWNDLSTGNQGTNAGKVTAGFDLGTYIAAANVGNVPVSVDATNALDYLVDAGTVLDECDVPREGRFIVLPAWYCGMLRKTDLKAADVTGDGTGVIRTGLIGEVNNFKIYESNLLAHSTDAGALGSAMFHCVFGVVDATTFASQITKTEISKVENGFGEKWKTLSVYGRKVIQPEALGMLYATKG